MQISEQVACRIFLHINSPNSGIKETIYESLVTFPVYYFTELHDIGLLRDSRFVKFACKNIICSLIILVTLMEENLLTPLTSN